MASQDGLYTFTGTVGNLTGYKVEGISLVKAKNTSSNKKIKTDPIHERTRENISEFSTASSMGSLVRQAFAPLLRHVNTYALAGNMTKHFLRIVKQDPKSARGQRQVLPNLLCQFTGFEFDRKNLTQNALKAPYTTHLNRQSGIMTVDFPSFIPAKHIKAPAGATHFSLLFGVATINIDECEQSGASTITGMTPLNGTNLSPLQLQLQVAPASPHPIMAVLGIRFYQNERGFTVPTHKTAGNSLKLIEVSLATDNEGN